MCVLYVNFKLYNLGDEKWTYLYDNGRSREYMYFWWEKRKRLEMGENA